MDIYRAIILVYPYGTYIRNGKKSIIVKSKNVSTIVGKPLLLVEDKLGLGIIELGEPKIIDLKEFRLLFRKHRIPEDDREKWWPLYHKLYSYNITSKRIFKRPIMLDYPQGPQITVRPKNLRFKQIYVGMSGYEYPGMVPKPKGIPMLSFYASKLNTVEINYTFYHEPNHKFIEHLNGTELVYSIKVNKFITHYKKLTDVANDWKHFYQICSSLNNLRCFLFQFGRRFVYDDNNFEKLSQFSRILNRKYDYVFEFRDESWFNKRVHELFRKHHLTMVISHIHGWANLENGFNPSLLSFHPTSDIIYFRLHGTTGQYTGEYRTSHFRQMFDFIAKQHECHQVYIYFNNTDDGHAWDDSIRCTNYFNPLNIANR